MLEKPDLPEEAISEGLRSGWGFSLEELQFLPIGNDAAAWVYRARGRAQDRFLKLRRGEVNRPALLVPDLLQRRGLRQAVAPLPALDGRLWVPLGDYHLILYPFIEGRAAMEVGLSADQRAELGAFLRGVHACQAADLPLAARRADSLRPPWAGMARRLDQRIAQGGYADPGGFADPIRAEAARFWGSRRAEINALVERAENLGAQLRVRGPRMVLCHADIHEANVLVGAAGALHVVDWDGAVLAPKERDLMFVIGRANAPLAERSAPEQEFLRGYDPSGALRVDALALAYYRYEWVVQEIGDFGERIFFSTDGGPATLAESLRELAQLFEPGDVVEGARACEQELVQS